MKCEICENPNPDLIVILPLRQQSGKLDTLACEACARKSSAYCTEHNRPHTGFMDWSTACLYCVEDAVRENVNYAASFRKRLQIVLPTVDFEYLNEVAKVSASLIGCSVTEAILRFLATKAVRTKKSVQAVVTEVEQSRSIKGILRI